MSLELLNNYILENKELIRQYICEKSAKTETTCTYFITKGKYKNSVCGRKVLCTESSLCKVHSKYTIESTNVETVVGIELTEFIYKGNRVLKTVDNIVYDKFERGYFPIGKYDEENDIVN